MKKINYEEKGITMIALITTIILLLIIAGVTIGTITGKDGIIEKARQAKEATEQAQLKEENDIDKLYAELASYNGTDSSNSNTTDTTPEQNVDMSNYYTKSETDNALSQRISMKKIWENTNPQSASSLTFTVENFSNYSYYEIEYLYVVGSSIHLSTGIIRRYDGTNSGILMLADAGGGGDRGFSYNENTFTFQNGRYAGNYTRPDVCMPIVIYGISGIQ